MEMEREGTNGMREPRRAKGIERTRQHNKRDTEPIIILPPFQSSKRTSVSSPRGGRKDEPKDDSIATQLTRQLSARETTRIRVVIFLS